MRVTAAQYRKNMDEYTQWEEEERARQDRAIALARMQMRDRRPGFKIPRWVRNVAVFMVCFALIVLVILLAMAL